MKKTIILLLIVSLLLITSCSGNKESLESIDTNDEENIVVYTSFYTLYDFASKIGGEKAKVINMVPSGGDPHHWEPTPLDIGNLEKADIFIYNGLSLEHWVDNVLAALSNEDLFIVEASKGVQLLESTHNHEDESDHSHGVYDPHIWLDPLRAKTMLENIKDAFIEADLENKNYYEENYLKYANKLDELDSEYKDALKDLNNRNIVVSHEAFAYLCEAYDLNQMGIEKLIPNSEPNPARMAEIIDYINENNIKTIFYEDINNTKVIEAISKETGVNSEILYTLEFLNQEQIDNNDDYFSVMRSNLESLKSVLE